MLKHVYVRFILLGCVLLESVCAHSIDTCHKYHKRAPVKSVCGRIYNILGEPPKNIELSLITLSGSVLSTARIDNRGRFTFAPVPKGDYVLRAAGPEILPVERELRITHDQDRVCDPRIIITVGFRACDGTSYVKGFDKKSDLLQ